MDLPVTFFDILDSIWHLYDDLCVTELIVNKHFYMTFLNLIPKIPYLFLIHNMIHTCLIFDILNQAISGGSDTISLAMQATQLLGSVHSCCEYDSSSSLGLQWSRQKMKALDKKETYSLTKLVKNKVCKIQWKVLIRLKNKNLS